jgi:hypothetical protein
MNEKKKLLHDKRGFSILIALMLGAVLLILGMALAPALKDTTSEAMSSSFLNCSSTSNQQLKAVCTSIDIQQWYVGIIFAIAGMVIYRMAT